MRRITLTTLGFTLAAGSALFSLGCARTIVETPNNTEYAAGNTEADLDFWHTLPGRPAITNSEGIHGAMQFVDGGESTAAYTDRLARLKEMGWLSEGFDEEPNIAMQRGTLAKLLAHALDIKGGVMMQLSNKSPRYATRELVYMQMMPPGTELQVLSGLEYIGVMQKAQDYLLLREADRRAAEAASQDAGGTVPAEATDSGDAPKNEAPKPGIGSPG